MKNNRRNIIVFILGLAFLIAILVAFNMYNKGPIDVEEAYAIETDPIALYNVYTTDSVAAQKVFDGKIVKLTGEVAAVSENIQKQQIILIKTSASGGNINCTMEKPSLPILPGTMLTVKGICSGIGQGDIDLGIAGDVYLTRTVIAN